MEEAVLYQVLREIDGSGSGAAPTEDYLSALETIGLISSGWDLKLTDFGESMMDYLQDKLDQW